MPNAVLLGYDLTQPSFRHRMRTLVEPLRDAGWQVRMEQFPSRRYGLRTWERRAVWRWAHVCVLHQIKLSGIEARLLATYAKRRVFDLDDAIYVRKPRGLGEAPDESVWRKKKFTSTCRWVDVVAAGNEVLAGAARAAAREIVILPTAIEVSSYRPTHALASDPPTVAWIGSPENLIYLEMIRPALARLSRLHPRLRLRVICSRFPDWDDVAIEKIPWSSATEAEALAGAHVGVMPLTDDAWARGKCAFKLLQYMAAALPCVASPVGANKEALIDGFNGFHASGTDLWESALHSLLVSPALRATMGANGMAHVREHFAMHTYRRRYAALLERLAAN